MPLTNITQLYGANWELSWVAELPHIANRFMPSRFYTIITFNIISYSYALRESVLELMPELFKPGDLKLYDWYREAYFSSIMDSVPEEAIATFESEYGYASKYIERYGWRKEEIDEVKGMDEEELGYDFTYVLSYKLTKICEALGIEVHDLYSKVFVEGHYKRSPSMEIFLFFNELKNEGVHGECTIERLREITSKKDGYELQVLDTKGMKNKSQNFIEKTFLECLNLGSYDDILWACVLCLALIMPKCYLVIEKGMDTDFCLVMPCMDERDIALTAKSLVALMCLSSDAYLSMREKTEIDFRSGEELYLEGIGIVKFPKIYRGLPSVSELQEPLYLLNDCLEEYWFRVVKPNVKKYGAERAFRILTGW